MATQVYRSNPGETAEQVTTTVGAATTKAVEVTVDLGALAATGLPRSQWQNHVVLCMERIQDQILRNLGTVF